ncbi:MAG: hypothetical protein OQL08_11795 [Gammaproteobacteria bacterium]|nr:hypothetical protein [Gammaproteobacteria bacterium]
MKRVALLLLLIGLTACSTKPNDEVIAQQVTAALLQRHSAAIFEVVNLKKVNGIVRDNHHYEAEMAYELRFLVDLQGAAARLQQQSGSIFAAGLEASALGLAYGNFKKGDTLPRREWIKFVRSEQGWLIDQTQP